MKLGVATVTALALAACAAPAILGKNAPDSVRTLCADGSSCPIGYQCPVAPGGRCEAADAPTEQWSKRPPLAPDAGSFTTEPDDPLLGEKPPGRGGKG